MTRSLLPAALLIFFVWAPCALEARPDSALTPPQTEGVRLDGRLEEPAWQDAIELPVEAVEVPTPEGPRKLAPRVRLLSCAGRLVLGVQMVEDPGVGMGLQLMVASEDATSAADAVSLGYRPFDPRSPRYRVLGPRGAGREKYRLQGAAEADREGAWSLEAWVPWADVAAQPTEGLRLAVVVSTRTPNVLTEWPAGALWQGPATWGTLRPDAGGWPFAVDVDADALAAEDESENGARRAWLSYLKGTATPMLPTQPRREVLEAFGRNVLVPLAEVLVHRPELEAPVRCLRGDACHRLGLWQQAAEEFRLAARERPGWREAHFGLHLKVLGPRRAEEAPGGPSDYAAAFARLDAAEAQADLSAWERQGLTLGRALLQYKHGECAEAAPVLAALAARYPFDSFLQAHARFAEAGRRAVAEEAARANRAGEQPRPKAHIQTSRGAFVIELFDKDARNAVRSFVHLGRKDFYDGLAFHRTVPFFLVQTGDPRTRSGAEGSGRVGTGTADYAIRTERNGRRMVRGAVALASAGPDSEGSQFYVLTGTAMHLQGEQTVFGRVLQGMAVVDALRAGDRILDVTFTDLDPQERYVPLAVDGTEPK